VQQLYGQSGRYSLKGTLFSSFLTTYDNPNPQDLDLCSVFTSQLVVNWADANHVLPISVISKILRSSIGSSWAWTQDTPSPNAAVADGSIRDRFSRLSSG
jgi:hypothetical protein